MSGRKVRIELFYGGLLLLFLLANVLLVQYGRGNIIHTGILDFTDAESIQKADITLDYVWTKNEEKVFLEGLNPADEICELLRQSDAILLVTCDGGVHQYEGSFSQTLSISRILSDTTQNLKQEDEITLMRYWGMTYDGGHISFEAPDGLNLMNQGREYLVFLKSSPMNAVSDDSTYWLMDCSYSIIATDRTYGRKTCPSYDFNRCRDLMHFTASERIAEAIAEQEETILTFFLKE